MVNFEKLDDVLLVRKVQEESCNDSFNELSRRHSNLFFKICHVYLKTLTALGCRANDVYEEKDFIIFEAISKFSPHKGSLFSTWLGNYTRYFCLNKINKIKKMPTVDGEDEIIAEFNNASIQEFEAQKPDVDFEKVLSTLSIGKDERITSIFKLRYNPSDRKKMTWAKIAERLNLTVQTTIQLHKKGLRILKREIETKDADIFQDSLAPA